MQPATGHCGFLPKNKFPLAAANIAWHRKTPWIQIEFFSFDTSGILVRRGFH